MVGGQHIIVQVQRRHVSVEGTDIDGPVLLKKYVCRRQNAFDSDKKMTPAIQSQSVQRQESDKNKIDHKEELFDAVQLAIECCLALDEK